MRRELSEEQLLYRQLCGAVDMLRKELREHKTGLAVTPGDVNRGKRHIERAIASLTLARSAIFGGGVDEHSDCLREDTGRVEERQGDGEKGNPVLGESVDLGAFARAVWLRLRGEIFDGRGGSGASVGGGDPPLRPRRKRAVGDRRG